MKAMCIGENGNFAWQDVPDPVCHGGFDVKIAVKACAVNRADLMQRAGTYAPPEGWPQWPGLECAGDVLECPANGRFKVGDKVCALLGGGGYAEQVVVPEGMVMPMPRGFDYWEAACIPEVYATAYLNLKIVGEIKKGETFFINGGEGGLGVAAIQLAKHVFGCKVVAQVASDENGEFCKGLGADVVCNRFRDDLVKTLAENPPDVAIDPVGGPLMGKCIATMPYRGRWISLASMAGPETALDVNLLWRKNLRVIGSTLRSRTPEEKAAILAGLVKDVYPAFESRKFAPFIHKVMPIAEAAEAHAILERGENRGKVVLSNADAQNRSEGPGAAGAPRCAVLALAASLSGALLAGTFSFEAKMDREPSLYKVGETAKLNLRIFEDGKPVGGKTAVCSWNYSTSNTVTVAESGSVFDMKLDRPGQVLFRADLYDGTNRLAGIDRNGKKSKALIVWAGALFSPEEIRPSRPRPADFDAYWDHEIAELNRLVPMGKTLPRVVRAKEQKKGFVAYDVDIPCWPRPACATLVVPENAEPRSLPLVVEFCGYGTSLAPKTGITNALHMGVNPHGFSQSRPADDWQRFMRAEGRFGYPYDGWESRETCFFHGQILRAVRSLQWAKTRPEWNGRDLIVTGVSMGGGQALQAAALDRDVTLCVPRDPAMCDHAGLIADHPHRPGWPWILASPRNLPELQGCGPVDPGLLAVSDYFDNVFFASRIKCPVYLATGLGDDVCFSEGVMMAFNAVKGRKDVYTDPYNIHCGTRHPVGERLVRIHAAPAKLTLAGDGKALPIVHGPSQKDTFAARHLRDCVKEMTGIEPRLVPAAAAKGVEKAVFVVSDAKPYDESFTTTVSDGAVRFSGAAYHAAYDFAERELGVRQYWPAKDGGRSVVRRDRIEVRTGSWSDAPFFKRRQNWPYDATEWGATFKPGDSLGQPLYVHAPHKWWSETNFNYGATRPEIFQLTRQGKRNPPMLCYGNPLTLETYKERIVGEIERGVSAGGIVGMRDKCITVSQWDGEVCCCCKHCEGLYDRKMGRSGDASPLLWGHFTMQLSDWLKEKYPDWTIVILPYINTCDVPDGLDFTNRNVVAMLCTMPGLAMLKQPEVKAHEEELIRRWARATGRKVINWHYSCWPAEFTAAPFVFGETISAHYRDCRDVIAGTFINGGWKPLARQVLSAYVWMKVLWNPDVDVHALYDEFADRMFGKAAKPMRELVRMLERGWNRRWNVAKTSIKNIYEISYPRHEVLAMQRLFAEARALAKGDETVLKRIDYYEREGGFERFFTESAENESGTAFEPVKMQKTGSVPILDGALDERDWAKATPAKLYSGLDKDYREARYPTELRVLWVPEAGVTFGFKCFDPDMAHARRGRVACLGNETVELYIDPTGLGEGEYGQILVDIDGNTLFYTESGRWDPEGVKAAVKTYDDRWEVELFVPFSALGHFAKAQIPDAGAGGRFWVGNAMRQRYSNSTCNIVTRKTDERFELTRLWTRYSLYNSDPSAFGTFRFEE